eukprot:821036-Pyramimonas_sp.AAC.1
MGNLLATRMRARDAVDVDATDAVDVDATGAVSYPSPVRGTVVGHICIRNPGTSIDWSGPKGQKPKLRKTPNFSNFPDNPPQTSGPSLDGFWKQKTESPDSVSRFVIIEVPGADPSVLCNKRRPCYATSERRTRLLPNHVTMPGFISRGRMSSGKPPLTTQNALRTDIIDRQDDWCARSHRSP